MSLPLWIPQDVRTLLTSLLEYIIFHLSLTCVLATFSLALPCSGLLWPRALHLPLARRARSSRLRFPRLPGKFRSLPPPATWPVASMVTSGLFCSIDGPPTAAPNIRSSLAVNSRIRTQYTTQFLSFRSLRPRTSTFGRFGLASRTTALQCHSEQYQRAVSLRGSTRWRTRGGRRLFSWQVRLTHDSGHSTMNCRKICDSCPHRRAHNSGPPHRLISWPPRSHRLTRPPPMRMASAQRSRRSIKPALATSKAAHSLCSCPNTRGRPRAQGQGDRSHQPPRRAPAAPSSPLGREEHAQSHHCRPHPCRVLLRPCPLPPRPRHRRPPGSRLRPGLPRLLPRPRRLNPPP